ncbi:MAG: phosphatase PAP2 family protein [Lacisediminihabitans sp.]
MLSHRRDGAHPSGAFQASGGRTFPAERTARIRGPLLGAVIAIMLVAAMSFSFGLTHDSPVPAVDIWWMNEIVRYRSPIWDVPALALNFIGGGIWGIAIIPAAILTLLLVLRRPWAAVFFAIATILSASAVHLIKAVAGRPRPTGMLVDSDFGSFPSGHVANAATMAVVIGLIVHRTWIWAAGVLYTVLMMLSRTYLGVHWLSDTIGAVLVGAPAAVIVWAALVGRIHETPRLIPEKSGDHA